jgi:hypothetical protein
MELTGKTMLFCAKAVQLRKSFDPLVILTGEISV